ncbi:MAG: hypothetical protein R3E10_09105 [Gemmatimonadota bacterium]
MRGPQASHSERPECGPYGALRRAALAWMLAVWALTGCYHYVPVAEPVPRGALVRAHLSSPLDVELRQVTARDVTLLDGELIRWDDVDGMAVSARWLLQSTGYEMGGEGWTVEIPADVLSAVEQRRLSLPRTLALVAGGVLGTYLAFDAIGIGGFGDGGGNSGGQTR